MFKQYINGQLVVGSGPQYLGVTNSGYGTDF